MSWNFDAVVVALVVIFLIAVLYKEWIRPGVAFMIATVVLLLCGIITPAESLAGFANEQLAVIVLLLIISNTLGKTRVVDALFNKIFKPDDGPRTFLFKMTAGIGSASAFLNNTPLVAMMLPFVYSWTDKKKLSPSQFLIPLSYASIIGGCVTLIGTSTNLIANGIAMEQGEESLGIFDFTIVGLPMLVIGGAYILIFSRKLLPSHPTSIERSEGREYFVETRVHPDSNLVGKSIEEASLRQLKGLYLVEIRRRRNNISPVPPDLVLQEDDKLFFVGDPDGVAELTKRDDGLSLPVACDLPWDSQAKVIELVIAQNADLINRKVKDTDFRGRYNGAIMAVHRGDERLKGKIGDIELQAGDVLLVLSGEGFLKRAEKSRNFYILSLVSEVHNFTLWKSAVVVGGLILSIFLAATELVPLFISLVTLVIVLIVIDLIKTREIKDNADMNLIVIIALGLALGKAMVNSGLAHFLATTGMDVLKPFGGWALIGGIFIITNLLSAFMTSKAAVAILIPVALAVAHELNMPVEPFTIVVALGGAANFITPIGYQTNLMVYTPGGYSFADYVRFGGPLTILYLVCTTWILTAYYGL